MLNNKLSVSSSPHIFTTDTTQTIMLDVIIALLPCVAVGTFIFGFVAFSVVVVSVCSCVLFEWLYQTLMKQKSTIGDLSAVVTGILLALSVPPQIPLFMIVIGSFFSIVVVKQLFGGIGRNFVNPALAGRAFMMASWMGAMTTYIQPFTSGVNAITTATPLATLSGRVSQALPPMLDCLFGIRAGCIGESSILIILLGFGYLLVRKVIKARSTLTYLAVFALFTFFFGKTPFSINYTLYSLLTGTVVFGAVFMITDYTTTPTTPKGQYIFATGAAILTFLIRRFGGYPEGFTYAVMLMNIVTPLIDKYTLPTKFGEV